MGTSGAARGQKTTFDGKRLSMEDTLQWKMTVDGRRPSMEDDFYSVSLGDALTTATVWPFFANISATKAPMFMKFETYIHTLYIIFNVQT